MRMADHGTSKKGLTWLGDGEVQTVVKHTQTYSKKVKREKSREEVAA